MCIANLSKRQLLACLNIFLMAAALTVGKVSLGFAEELPINQEQTQAILKKTQALEAEIQHRQQDIAVNSGDSKEYQSGFEDGYNKAILDLLKSKLLNDPTLSPKPKGAGLYANPHTPQRQRYPSSVNTPSAGAVTSPATPITVPAASIVPLAPLTAPKQVSIESAIEPVVGPTTITTTTTSATTVSSPLESAPPQQPTAQEWLQKSNAFLAEKQWQPAIDAAAQAIAVDSSLVDAYIVRSWAYAETGQSQPALEDIAAAISMDPKNALAYNNRAYIHELLNKAHDAQQDYHQSCTLGYQPACETARKLKQALEQQRLANITELTNLSYQQFQQQNWQGVVKTTSELLLMDPENTAALVNRAGAYTELGQYQKAMDDCNTALIIDPKMAIAYNNKGYVLELMGELKKAAMEYETACVLGVQQSCSDYKRLSQKVSLN